MRTYAGDILIDVEGSWENASQYVYRMQKQDVEVRVEHQPVKAEATPDGLMDPIVDKLQLLGPLEKAQRTATRAAGQPAAALSVTIKRPQDKEASHMEIVVFKAKPTRAITITATAGGRDKASLATVWKHLLFQLKIVEV